MEIRNSCTILGHNPMRFTWGFDEEDTKWTPDLHNRYFAMLEQCTYVTSKNPQKTENCQLLAYRHCLDQSHYVLAVYDPSSIE